MDIKKIISEMTTEEKAILLTGATSMTTAEIERLGIESRRLADGTAGVRAEPEDNCVLFPAVSCVGSSWDKQAARKLGRAMGKECAHHGISMILGPGMNIKRNVLCGRNFEYYSEDPVITGELASEFILGLKEEGVCACPKHYAMNNQEKHRLDTSVEVDERTMREIYLRGFEIAVKKSHPDAMMCAYNKVNSVWCSENKHLLRDILKDEWGFDGLLVSDWGAVHNICKAVEAGLDLQMPPNGNIVNEIKKGLADGTLSEKALDEAVERVLRFVALPIPKEIEAYDRAALHDAAKEIAAAGIVLLKNENKVLPLTEKKYKKIYVVGEYAVSPLIQGQGSAEVYQAEDHTDIPLEELKKRLPNCEIEYIQAYKKREFSSVMLWPGIWDFRHKVAEADAVIMFAGAMESEDTENFDRRSLLMNPNYEMFIEGACKVNRNVIIVLQSGGAIALDYYCKNKSAAIVYAGLGGEAAGGALADVLCGIINPSGRLSETFPTETRTDLDYPGNGYCTEYNEKLAVGYRYYDRHPEKVQFPFGHGLSYTEFRYSDMSAEVKGDEISVEFSLENTGDFDGAEVFGLYASDPYCTLSVPEKELVYFDKIFLAKGEKKNVSFTLPLSVLSHYNVSLGKYIVEDGRFDLLIGASSQDIRLKKSIFVAGSAPYSMTGRSEPMIG